MWEKLTEADLLSEIGKVSTNRDAAATRIQEMRKQADLFNKQMQELNEEYQRLDQRVKMLQEVLKEKGPG